MLRRLIGMLTRQSGSAKEHQSDPAKAAAHVEGKDAPHHHHNRRAVKDWHTNHWDLDFLSRDELESLANRQQTPDR